MRLRVSIFAFCALAAICAVAAVSVGADQVPSRTSRSGGPGAQAAAPAAGAPSSLAVGGAPSTLTPTPTGMTPAVRWTPGGSVALRSGWSYLPDPHDQGVARDWPHGGAAGLAWQRVRIPHDFNPVVSDAAGDYGSVAWYKDHFTGPDASPDRTWTIRFEEIRRIADVWLNGVHLGSNADPYAGFELPASSLRPRAQNTLVIRVDNRRPQGSWPEDWWNWGGIVRPVELVATGRVSLAGLGVLPVLGCRLRCGSVLVEGTLTNPGSTALRPQIEVRARSPRGRLTRYRTRVDPVPAGGSRRFAVQIALPGRAELWSPATPRLYRVEVRVRMPDGTIETSQRVHTGLRQVAVRHGALLLNGKRLWLHGASIHEDMPGHGAALTNGDIATIVSELKAVGANVTRAHYLLSDRLLTALDRAGILVWAQVPVDHAEVALRTHAGRTEAMRYLRETVLGGRSHPSVIINSVGNELTPTPDSSPGTLAYLEAAVALARTLDPAAAVALDTYCYPGFPAQSAYRAVDVLGISHYFGWYQGLPGHPITAFGDLVPFLEESHRRYPGQALVVSEFGAEARFDGPADRKGSYAFQSDYIDQTFDVLDALPFMNGAIYWTLREFAVSPGWRGGADLPPGEGPDGLHHKGLIAYDGTPKPAFGIARRRFGQTPDYVRTSGPGTTG